MVAVPPVVSGSAVIGPNKAIASGLAGAVITVAIWVVKSLWQLDVPAEVAAALTTIVGTALVWLVPHGGQ